MTPPIRILLVDDHPLVREGLMARLSSQANMQVVGEAGNAQQTFDAVPLTQPDLVLMDVGMKDVSGIELAARLLERHPTLLILMLSMYDNPEYVNRAMAAGARGYVLKDAPSQEIIEAVQAVVAGQTYLSAAISGRLMRSQTPRPVVSLREAQILSGLAQGHSSKQIALTLGLSIRTVETHRQNIKRKLNLNSQGELIKYAVQTCLDIGSG